MSKGDHLIVKRDLYTHHGIDLGDGRVMQYGGGIVNATEARVEIVDLDNFSRGAAVVVVEEEALFDAESIVERAYSRLDEDNYSLFRNNCEHFVQWCRNGVASSRQAESIVERTASIAAKLSSQQTINHLAGTAVAGSVRLGTKSGIKPLAPWLLLADAAQFGVELTSRAAGEHPEQAKRQGQIAGIGASLGIGLVVGGPAAALVGLGAWAFGEALGQALAPTLTR